MSGTQEQAPRRALDLVSAPETVELEAHFLRGKEVLSVLERKEEGRTLLRAVAQRGHLRAQVVLADDLLNEAMSTTGSSAGTMSPTGSSAETMSTTGSSAETMSSTGSSAEFLIEESLAWRQRAAEQGDVPCMAMMGNHHADGIGVSVNLETAAQWWSQSAQTGHVDSAYNLGLMYLTQNKPDEAVYWLEQASAAGDPGAKVELGNYWYHFVRDTSRAESLWKEAAAEGSCDALVNLGLMALDLNQSDRARAYLTRAAALGDEEAQLYLDGKKPRRV